MRVTSVRLRLALWNMGMLALVLAAFGAAIRYTDQIKQITSLDWQLDIHAQHLLGGPFGESGGWPPPPDLGPPGVRGRFENSREPGPRSGFGPPGVGGWFAEGRGPGPRSGFLPHPGGWGPRERRPGRWRLELGPPPGPPPPLPFEDRFVDPGGRVVWGPAGAPWDRPGFAKALRGQMVHSTATVAGKPVRLLSLPVRQDAQLAGVLQIAAPLIGIYGELDRLSGVLMALFPVALLVAALGGLLLTDRALRPVRQITQAAAQIGASDLSERLPVSGKDEFSELAATFNGMLGRLERAFTQLAQTLEQQRRFTADASHELRTPLTVIKANTSLALEEERSNAEYRRALEAADRATDTTTRIVQDLLLLARGDAGQLRMEQHPIPMNELLERAVEAFRSSPAAPIAIQLLNPSLTVPGDSHHLLRLFTNLLENAVRHTPETGSITLTTAAEGESVVVRIRDTGEGIPPEHLPHVCGRFYRVDAARTRRPPARGYPGTGLGLAICQSIVEAHDGWLTIESVVGKGTTVTVRLPGPIALAGDDPAPSS